MMGQTDGFQGKGSFVEKKCPRHVVQYFLQSFGRDHF